jgi:hypothetical protein
LSSGNSPAGPRIPSVPNNLFIAFTSRSQACARVFAFLKMQMSSPQA